MLAPNNRSREQGTAAAWSWHHAGLVVEDLDSAITFYRETLGFSLAFEVRGMSDQFARIVGIPGVSCDLAQLTAPFAATRLELIRVYHLPAGCDPSLPVHVGVGHTAYQVRDLEASLSAIMAAGGSRLGEIVEFAEGRAVYCRTLSGTVLELEEEQP